MLGDLKVFEIQIIYKQGYSLKEISRKTNHSINTVRKYARDNKKATYSRSRIRKSKLEDYKSYQNQHLIPEDWIAQLYGICITCP